MKNYPMIMLCLLATFSMTAQDWQSLTVPLSTPGKRGRLEIQNMKGPVTVKGADRQNLLVKYQALGSQEIKVEDVGGGLKKISGGFSNLEVSEKNNRVEIQSNNFNKGMKIEVEVPADFDLDIHTMNHGNVWIENIRGEATIEALNGRVDAMKISGSVVASSFNGGIRVQFDQLTADTPLAFTNFNGEIDLTLPSSSKADFKFKMMQGDIFTAFDMDIKPEMIKQKEEGGFSLDGWMVGKINGGGPVVRIESHHGDVYIRKKQ